MAQKLRPRRVSDFANLEVLRQDLIQSIGEYRREQSEFLIGDFDAATFKAGDSFFLRIGAGSLGGKARGLAFVRHLLYKRRFSRRFPGVRIGVPPALVLSTDVFDHFLSENNLLEFAIHSKDDAEIERRFMAVAFAGFSARGSARISERSNVSAGRSFLQLAGGFAVPALHRRL